MSIDATKKQPRSATSEPQELEHQIRLRAFELYEGVRPGRPANPLSGSLNLVRPLEGFSSSRS